MNAIKRALPIVVFASAIFIVTGCASQEAEHKTYEVEGQTGSAVGSVLDAAGAVIMYPVHLVGDLFT